MPPRSLMAWGCIKCILLKDVAFGNRVSLNSRVILSAGSGGTPSSFSEDRKWLAERSEGKYRCVRVVRACDSCTVALWFVELRSILFFPPQWLQLEVKFSMALAMFWGLLCLFVPTEFWGPGKEMLFSGQPRGGVWGLRCGNWRDSFEIKCFVADRVDL